MTTEPTQTTRPRTFLFADVRGYTRFTREHGDSEAARLATRFAQLSREAVASRSGRVVELRGDEVMAVFDDELQAVRAAIELQATLTEEMASDPSLPLNVGIGIDAGEAVPVGDGFRGSALNLAARLCARAEAGQVLVSATVWGRCAEAEVGRFQPLGPAELKGFERPVDVFEAVAESGRLETPPRLAAPAELPPALLGGGDVVGRDGELDWLRGAWRGARRGAGRMVVVSGPEGMGKSSLAAAFAGEVAAEGYTVLYAGSGGAALAELGDVCLRVRQANRPVLAVLDDLTVLGDQAAGELTTALAEIGSAPVLVLCLVAEDDASPALAAVVADVDAHGDGRRALAPLDASGVERIAVVYAGDDADQVPLDAILRASGGTPARVHELLDAWAGEEAARRLEAAAEWLAVGRDRRSAGLAFANNAIERRLAHLYGDAPAPAADPPCPYKGLAAFDEHDAAAFFGRERLIGELAARTVGSGLLALVGPSGSGKSSLMLAGLVPSLRAGLLPGSARWKVATLRPGAHPLAELGESLLVQATSNERLVVAVDQFEEAFTLCTSGSERAAFIDELAALANEPDRFVVVLAVRGDFLDDIAAHPTLAQLVSANQVLVPPMGREDYRRAIEQPARRAGVRVESALSEALLDEAAGEPGALPLLSTALVEIWNQRRDGWMRMDSFTTTGGLHGAVARLAEASYAQLDEPGRRIARRVFLRLAGAGEGDAITRARVPIGEFEVDSDPVVATVIDRFVADRLLIRDEQTLEVSHEALLREWPRLRTWLDEEGQGRLVRQHLTQAAHYWDDNGRRAGDLYRAERLAAAQTWSAEHGEQLNALEREFLDASQAASTRAIRRLRAGIAVLTLLLLAAIIAGILALSQRRSAQHSADIARTQARVAIGQRVGFQALKSTDMATSLLLAVAGDRLAPSAVADGNLLQALLRAGSTMTIYHSPARLLGDAVTPDGRILAANTNDGRVILFDTATAREIAMLPDVRHINPVGSAFSPDGSLLAAFAGNGHGLIVLFDTKTHRVVATAADPLANTSIDSAAFSPDGRFIAGLSFRSGAKTGVTTGAALYVWSVPSLHRIAGPVAVRANGASVSVTPHGEIVTTSQSGITLWRAHPLRVVHRYAVPNSGALLAPDGTNMAVLQRHTLAFVDLRTGTIGPPTTLPGGFHPAAFSKDGKTLFGTAHGGRVAVLDMSTGVLTVVTSQGHFNGFSLAPDGRSLYTVSLDKTAVRWGIGGASSFAPGFRVAPPGGGSIVASPGGGLVATLAGPPPGHGATVKVWNMRTGRLVAGPLNAGAGGAGWAALSPDGRLVAAPSFDTGQVKIWDTRTGNVVRRLVPPATLQTLWIAFSPNGRLVATATERQVRINPPVFGDGTTYVWNVRSGHLIDSFRQPGKVDSNGVSTAIFNADSDEIVSVGDGGSVAVRDIVHHRLVSTPGPTHDAYTIQGVFSPDGRVVATGGYGGGLVSLWTPSGRRLPPPITSVGTVFPAGFYNGGRRLAVGRHHVVQLWDVPGRRLIGTLPVGGSANPLTIVGATVTPDGRTLVTTSSLGRLRVWPLERAQWIRDACLMANRELTLSEWRAYLTSIPYMKVCS